jgi:hypothetical protein
MKTLTGIMDTHNLRLIAFICPLQCSHLTRAWG